MEHRLSSSLNFNNRLVITSPSTITNHCQLNRTSPSRFSFSALSVNKRRRSTVVVAGASDYSSYCKFSGLNTPIEPVTPAGRFLSSVLLNERRLFHDAVAETLDRLVADVDEAFARKELTDGSSEGFLHRCVFCYVI